MSVNNSSSTNGSFPAQQSCHFSRCIVGEQIFSVSVCIYIALVLPLSVSVLSLGLHQWKQQRPSEGAMSSSDFFTYNLAVLELVGILGSALYFFSTYTDLPVTPEVGYIIMAFPWFGQMFLPVLTCADRYMAVVHPITYRLKQVTRIHIRNITTGFIWLQGFGGFVFLDLVKSYPEYTLIPSFCVMLLSLLAVIYCSLPVLCVLIRPRPGEVGRKKADQSKQRAFNTIIIILGVLFLRFGGNLVCNLVTFLPTISCSLRCLLLSTAPLFSLPSSLVLPLLFLHRTGKLPGFKHNTVPG